MKYNFDRASAFNVSILERIRSIQAAKNMPDLMSEINAFERRHQEDFAEMRTHGIAVYPKVKKAEIRDAGRGRVVTSLGQKKNGGVAWIRRGLRVELIRRGTKKTI